MNAWHDLRNAMVGFVVVATVLCTAGPGQAAPEPAGPSAAPPAGADGVAAEPAVAASEASPPPAPEPAAEDESGVTPPAGAPAPTDSPALTAPAGVPPPPAPTSGPASAEPATSPAPGSADETSGTDWPFVGGLITLAGGVGLLVAGHYGMFRLEGVVREDEMRAYRQGVPEGESACDFARSGFVSGAEGAPGPDAIVDRCDEAESMEVLRNVALPLGAAATVAGLLLIGTSDTVNDVGRSEQARGWRLRVGAGPQGGAATATLHF